MASLQSVTIIYLVGLICLFQAAVHFLALHKNKDLSQKAWVAYSALMGLGLIWLVAAQGSPQTGEQINTERYFPVFAFFLILVAQLARFTALSQSFGRAIQKKPLMMSIAGIFAIVFLYKWSLYLGAPLGSLETIVLLPLAASSCITAWYAGSLSHQKNYFSISWLSKVLWVEAAIFVCLALGALAGMGQDYIDLNSGVILAFSLAVLFLQLGTYMLWFIHCGEKNSLVFRASEDQLKQAARKVNAKSTQDNQVEEGNLLLGKTKAKSKFKSVSKVEDGSETALTSKELDVLKLVVTGSKNKEIADSLGISEASMKVHKSRMTSKLGVKTIPELKDALEKILSSSSQEPKTAMIEAPSDITPSQGSPSLA
jgi:DNA-binding CsgD family transcriptional regulator